VSSSERKRFICNDGSTLIWLQKKILFPAHFLVAAALSGRARACAGDRGVYWATKPTGNLHSFQQEIMGVFQELIREGKHYSGNSMLEKTRLWHPDNHMLDGKNEVLKHLTLGF